MKTLIYSCEENKYLTRFISVFPLCFSIHLGLVLNRLPPYPLMFKADTPALEIQIRDLTAATPEWKPLFEFDPSTGMMRGGKTFTFPQSSERVELRAL